MNKSQVVALVIHLLLPLLGLLVFLKIKKDIKLKAISSPPIKEIFVLFFTYGGLIMVIYTIFFWQWSGGASLGVFYLMILAPIVMVIIAYKQFKKKEISLYHRWVFNLSVTYILIAPLIFFLLFKFAGDDV